MAEEEDDHNKSKAKSLGTCIFFFFIIIILVIIIAVVVPPTVYRFVGPRFTVVDGVMYGFNMTSPPHLLFSTANFTVLVTNPSGQFSFHSDGLTATVWYMSMNITTPQVLPPLTLGRQSSTVMSLVLSGEEAVPVSSEGADELARTEKVGGTIIMVSVQLLGTLRWEDGVIKTDVGVRCDVPVGVKSGLLGELHLLRCLRCRVYI